MFNNHPVVGASMEVFIIEQLIAAAPKDWTPWFYRSSGGAEIDLISETPKERYAIEVKRNLTPAISRGFRQASADIEAVKSLGLT